MRLGSTRSTVPFFAAQRRPVAESQPVAEGLVFVPSSPSVRIWQRPAKSGSSQEKSQRRSAKVRERKPPICGRKHGRRAVAGSAQFGSHATQAVDSRRAQSPRSSNFQIRVTPRAQSSDGLVLRRSICRSVPAERNCAHRLCCGRYRSKAQAPSGRPQRESGSAGKRSPKRSTRPGTLDGSISSA